MSRCISSHGEYGEHTFPTPESARGEDRFTCTLCGVFDEWEALDALRTAEAIAQAAREYVAAVGRLSNRTDVEGSLARAVGDAYTRLLNAVEVAEDADAEGKS